MTVIRVMTDSIKSYQSQVKGVQWLIHGDIKSRAITLSPITLLNQLRLGNMP
jgi:hypothetical protein